MTDSLEEDPRLTAAHRAAGSGEFAQAERLLQEVLAEDADCVLALDILGFVQFFLGRPAEAEQACRRAIAIEPDRAYSNKGLGLCLAKQGKLDVGLPFLLRAIALAPEWADPRWDLAIVLADGGRPTEALEVLLQAERDLPAERPRFEQLRREIVGRQPPTSSPR